MHYCTPPKTRDFPLLGGTLVSHPMTAAFVQWTWSGLGKVSLRALEGFNVDTKCAHGDMLFLGVWLI